MASEGSVYQRKDGRWVAQYTDAKGKVRYIYRKSKGEAKQALREALRDRDQNIVPPSKMTVGLYLDEWLEDRRDTVSARTWRNQESILRCRVMPHIGSQKLSKLSSRDATTLYRRMLADGLAASTVGQIHVLLKQAMRDAVRSKYIRSNPLDAVKPPKQQRREIDVLTAEQVKALLEAARGDRCEAIIVCGALCALRIGESLSIKVEDIDFDKGTLKVRHTLYHGKVYQPKTASSYRTVKPPRIALDALRRHCEGREQGYVFQTSTGNPVDASNFYKWSWRPLLRKAGLPETLTYHRLRATAASLLLSQKVPIPVVTNYLGHSNSSITLKVYASMIDGDDGLAGTAMDDLLAQPIDAL